MKPILSIALICCILLTACTGKVGDVELEVPSTHMNFSPETGSLGLSAHSLGLSESALGLSNPGLGISADRSDEPEIYPEGRVSFITPSLGISIKEMREHNDDTVGWLQVPGTTINDPIVRNPEGDNNFYTTHNFDKVIDRNGAYGADFRCELLNADRDSLQRNTTLYAHNHTEDPNGELFAQLKKYKDPAYAAAHPYIFFSTLEEDMVWEVFAVFDSNTDLPYIVPDLPWDIYSRILDVAYEASIFDYGITAGEDDHILTLSTCSFVVPGRDPIPLNVQTRYRFVVLARLVDPDVPIREQAEITENIDPLPPDRMPPIYHPGLDVFCYGGVIYATDPRWNLEADFSDAVVLGEIARTGISYDLRDGDATNAPVGAKIYGYPNWDEMVAVEREGKIIAYAKYWWPEGDK